MSIQLLIGESIIGGSVNPTPAVSIGCVGVHHPVTGELVGVEYTWDVKGVLLDKGADSIATQAATLEGLFSGLDGTETVSLKDGETVLAELVGSNAVQGLNIDPPSYLEGSGVEWATKRTYSLGFTAEFPASGITEWAEWTLSITTDERGIDSRAAEGTYHKQTSSDIKSDCRVYVESIIAPDVNYQRSENYSMDGVSSGVYGKTCLFNITDRGLWKQMPTGCSTAGVTKAVTRNSGGGSTMTLSGSFTGTDSNIQYARDAVTAVLSQYDSLAKLSEDIAENEYEGTVSFSAEFLQKDSEIIEGRQEVTISEAFPDFVMQPILDGRPPLRQNTVMRSATARQSGYSLSSIRLNAPYPIWPYNIKERPTFSWSIQQRDVDSKAAVYRVDWTYEYEFETTPFFAGL